MATRKIGKAANAPKKPFNGNVGRAGASSNDGMI